MLETMSEGVINYLWSGVKATYMFLVAIMRGSYNTVVQHFPTVRKQSLPASTQNMHPSTIVTMSNTAASPLSFPTNHNAIDYLAGLGDLVTLPLEVRDEIYRYLVKGVHRAADSSNWPTIDPVSRYSWITKTERKGLEPITLRLSKAIKFEAERILFSESFFLCSLDIYPEMARPPQSPFDRMMKIKIEVLAFIEDISDEPMSSQNQNEKWGTVITKLNDTHLVRKIVHVNFRIHSNLGVLIRRAVASNMLHDLRTLSNCRTLIVEFSSMFPLADKRPGSKTPPNRTRGYIEDIDFLAETTMGDLECAMGPATLGHTRAPHKEPDDHRWPGYSRIRYASFLEFHPQNHMAKRSII